MLKYNNKKILFCNNSKNFKLSSNEQYLVMKID